MTDLNKFCGRKGCPGGSLHAHDIDDHMFVECDGCGGVVECGDPKRYLVTHHDGSESAVLYCDDCADLARMDWNGETKTIRPLAAEGAPCR